jgi:hypothetical protein
LLGYKPIIILALRALSVGVSSVFNKLACRYFYDVAPYLRREKRMSFMGIPL